MTDPFVRSIPAMGTIVTLKVVNQGGNGPDPDAAREAIDRAIAWFDAVERTCTRFDRDSELMRLAARPGNAVPVSDILFQALEFAVAVAEDTGGAFDPTVGRRMEASGFDRHYRTGETISSAVDAETPVSYRDIQLDRASGIVTLRRPLVPDLGAIAKGLAIDLAAQELAPFEHFAIDAGGDLYLKGLNARGERWSIGLRHPRRERELLDTVRVSNAAVCTSGDYERPSPAGSGGHHILDPRNGRSADVVVSATVIAPTALLADALATAAFVLGPSEGLALLQRHGVNGLIVSPALETVATPGMFSDHELGRGTDAPLLPHA